METITKKAILVLFISFFASFPVKAQDSTLKVEETAFVNFLKVEDGQLFFTVKYSNAEGRKFNVVVYNQDGENLYRGNFANKNFGKIFCAPVEMGKLQVIVRENKGKAEHKFEISSEARVIREAYVTAVSNRR
jgi:hypothetical protein